MSFQVYLTEAAKDDIRIILRWIGNRSSAGAEAWRSRWLETLDDLKSRAETFGIAPESEAHREKIRQALFRTKSGKTYRTLFVIRDHDVFVLHIRGPGQDLLPKPGG